VTVKLEANADVSHKYIIYIVYNYAHACIYAVCKITFEKWVDILSGHDKVSMDMDRIVWT